MKLSYKKITSNFLSLVFFLFFVSYLSVHVKASYTWSRSTIPEQTNSYYAQDIRISHLSSNIIFAAVKFSNGNWNLLKSIDGGINFNQVNNLTHGAEIPSIALSYSNSNNVWANIYTGGVYKSTDGGLTWNYVTTGILNKYTRYIAVDPTNDSVLYLGTGTSNFDGGIYKSINGGDSWFQIGMSTFGNKNSLNIFIDPRNTQHILAGSDFGLFESINGGDYWSLTGITQNTSLPFTLIDNQHFNRIISGIVDVGIYATYLDGLNWHPANINMGSTLIHRLVQNTDGTLFAMDRANKGVWYTNDLEQGWSNLNSEWYGYSGWGADAVNGKIILSINLKGIYYNSEEPTPLPSPTPTPSPSPTPFPTPDPKVVFVPGFGGSIKAGMITGLDIPGTSWTLTPFKTDEYKALLQTFKNAGLTEGVNLFGFYYDWRQPVKKSGEELLSFLNSLSSDPNQKFNVIAHSLGGLVARSCAELENGCKDKFNKLITAGSPHTGAVGAYYLWNNDVPSDDVLTKAFGEMLINLNGNNLRIAAPSIKDFLPIFDYINWENHNYALMNPIYQNPFLVSLGFSNLADNLTTFSGSMSRSTPEQLFVRKPTWWQKFQEIWLDGKPTKNILGMGDDTILDSSATAPVGTNFKFDTWHSGLVATLAPEKKILEIFGLPTENEIVTAKENKNWNVIWFIKKAQNPNPQSRILLQNSLSSNYFNVSCYNSKNKEVDVLKLDDDAFVAVDPPNGKCKIEIPKNSTGNFEVFIGDVKPVGTYWQSYTGNAKKGSRRWYNLKHHFLEPLEQKDHDDDRDD